MKTISNRKLVLLTALFVASLAYIFLLYRFYTPKRIDDSIGDAVTANRLNSLVDYIRANNSGCGFAASNSLDVIASLDLGNDGYVPSLSKDKTSIVDYWERKVLVLSINGFLWGFASLGEDGIWSNGKGDDIVVFFCSGEGIVKEKGIEE